MPFADSFSGRIRKATRLALNEVGRRGVAHIRSLIDVRVQYVGSWVIRSDPGEPPRREHRDLQKSITYKVEAKATTLEDMMIYVDDSRRSDGKEGVAFFLEYGTFHVEPRPFWEVSREVINRFAYETFQERFLTNLVRLNADASMEFDSSDAAQPFPADDSAFPID